MRSQLPATKVKLHHGASLVAVRTAGRCVANSGARDQPGLSKVMVSRSVTTVRTPTTVVTNQMTPIDGGSGPSVVWMRVMVSR